MTTSIEMETKAGEPCKLVVHEELQAPVAFADTIIANVEGIVDMNFRDDDILLCTYPKSGTHWVAHLIAELRKPSPDAPKTEGLGLLEISPLERLEAAPSPRLIYTHLRPRRLQQMLNTRCKVIMVLRNPKDVAVSCFHHMKNAIVYSNPQTWDEYFASFMKDAVPFGSYVDYLNEWDQVIKKGGCKCSISVFYFEDIKQSPLDNVRRLSKVLGFDKTDEELEAAIKACSIEHLREEANKDADKILPSLRTKEGKHVIFRKGDVGDWKTHFTVAQNEVHNEMLHARLEGSSFMFVYDL